MTTSVMGPEAAASARPGLPSRLFALMPLWVLLILSAFSPISLQAISMAPPDFNGVPLGLIVEGAALLWMLAGLVVIWAAASRLTESLALLAFTIPATVVVVFTPAVILVLQNLR